MKLRSGGRWGSALHLGGDKGEPRGGLALGLCSDTGGQCGLRLEPEASIPILPSEIDLKIRAEVSWLFLFKKKNNGLKSRDRFLLRPQYGRGSEVLAAALWCGLRAPGVLGVGLNVLGTEMSSPIQQRQAARLEWEDKNKTGSLIEILHRSRFSPHSIFDVRIFSAALTSL